MNYNRRATSVEELEIKYDDDLHLREVVLKARLQELAGKLLKRPDEAGRLESLLWEIIVASQLNRRAVPISAGRDAKRKVGALHRRMLAGPGTGQPYGYLTTRSNVTNVFE
jgi:hypothetical protein